MKRKSLIWPVVLGALFLFLPSLAVKIWDFLVKAPWPYKSWLVYLLISIALIKWVRWRWKHRKLKYEAPTSPPAPPDLLYLAKERLVKGEISLQEFREIKQELFKPEVENP
ncbi:MAG: hypothetical protein K6U80_10900 [Firmicutes bacterium]|nr:hypothetical protein [Bacillota bacterium]